MRTLAQIAAEMQPLVKKIEDLLGDETKSVTDAEMTEVETLQAQVDTLQAEYDQVKKVSDSRTANASRKSMFASTPAVKHAQGNGGNDSAPVVEFPMRGNLKHFRGATEQEANMKAYRFGQFLKGYVLNPMPGTGPAAEWCKANGIEYKAAQAEGTIADGGALVPQEFERTLIDLREMYGTFRPNAKTEPMASETKLIPRRTGGLTAYFVGEAAAGTTSNKTFDLVQLTAKKLMALVPYSTEVAEDAIINLADDLAGEIAYAFALKEDQCGWLGDGTSTYGGITGVTKKLLNLSGTIANIAGIRVQATVSTGTFNSAVLADFQGTIAKLPKYADTPRAKWYMHKSFYHAIPGALMAAAGGNNISDLQGGVRRPTFLGYPVEFVQVLPTVWVADTIYALFGDLSLAASFGDRRATTLFTDPYSLSANDQVQIRGTERFDINVHDVGNASGTAASRVPGPIVAFASAAS
jgi:HK97 family phage major capsid protein